MEDTFDVSKFEIQELETIEAPISGQEVAGIATGIAVGTAAAVLAD